MEIISIVSIILCIISLAYNMSYMFSGVIKDIKQRLANRKIRPRGKVSKSFRTDPRNRKLQEELLGLLRWDVATAKRLLKRERGRNPGRSDNWYLEKVIHDLERDRR
jgi:hypothetical protein